MQDVKNREMMAAVYRLIEKYERPPTMEYVDEANEYFSNISADCQDLFDAYKGNHFAELLTEALFKAIDANFREKNKMPLKER